MQIEHTVSTWVRFLERQPRTRVFLGALALGLIAFFTPGWLGAALTLALVGLLGALVIAAWPTMSVPARVARLAVLAVLTLLAISKL